MQPAGVHLQHNHYYRRKANAPPFFANHTPRAWEITATDPSPQSPGPPDMFGAPTGMTIGAEPFYCANSNMGQAPSSTTAAAPSSSSSATHCDKRDKIRKASSTILREDSIQQTEEIADDCHWSSTTVPLSREDSWSMHYDCTNQAPYSNAHTRSDGSMITQSSLVNLPRDNKYYDLAFFLKTTGPTAPHRRPSKIEPVPPKRSVSGKNAFRFLRRGQKRDVTPVQSASDRLNGMLRDEGGLLIPCVQQKVSWTGKPYLALQVASPKLSDVVEHDDAVSDLPGPSSSSYLSPDILDSRVSICFHEESNNSELLDSYLQALNKQQCQQDATMSEDHRPATSYEEIASRLSRRFPTPIRQAASNPPTPEPESASMAESYATELADDQAGRDYYDTGRILSGQATPAAGPLTPKISLPREEFPVKHPSPEKEVEIKHPVPRRLGSYPVLTQRASSIASTLGPSRSYSDSPGPPPPRSPLRLRRDPRTIESIIANHSQERKPTPKIAPSIKSASDFDFGVETIKATVTTECTGPIKRPKSRNKNPSPHRRTYPTNRKEREERVRARKLRDRPAVSRTIDSVVHAPAQATRQRLKKIRPQIQIPDFRPPPLRAASAASHASASSAASWRKVTQSTQTPVSPVPSRASEVSQDDRATYTPISPTAQAAEERSPDSTMNFSPVMLVAEEVPVPKTKPSPKPTKLILKEGKTYAPRPRSASYSRAAIQRRSRTSVNHSNQNSLHSSPRPKSPSYRREEDKASPLPSPPPTRALPPTPPASGSERPSKANSKAKVIDKTLPTLPSHSHSTSPISSTHSKTARDKFPHIATQQSKSKSSSSSRAAARMDARLEALEKQNALLSAALMAVLRTNGALNGTIPGLLEPESPKGGGGGGPMAWESRVARRSAATSHTASSSNGSALEMYMSTRRGSRQGC